MPYLFCKRHGRQHEASSRGSQEEYQQIGETVVIVSGTLISGPWQCDRCNAALNKGDAAYLVAAYPSHYADELAAYDYGYERRYFQVEKATVKVYGAMPVAGIASPATAWEEC